MIKGIHKSFSWGGKVLKKGDETMTKGNISVDVLTERILASSVRPLSTYEIAKKAKISWPTANTHCYKLKSMGRISCQEEHRAVGIGKKTLWYIK